MKIYLLIKFFINFIKKKLYFLYFILNLITSKQTFKIYLISNEDFFDTVSVIDLFTKKTKFSKAYKLQLELI